MLVNKGITIDNFEEYWTYLSKRGELVELEKNQKSGPPDSSAFHRPMIGRLIKPRI